MSFPHHLALFKDLSCPLLPTIARHCPRLPAKKMSQAVVASQYGRRSRGPGRVPRAAPRQPGCTAEPTNHEPRSFLARGASRREFRGFHESRVTRHESRLFFSVGAPGRRHRKPPSGPLRPPASHCFPVHRCSPLFTIVHYCSPLFAIVHLKILFGARLHVSPRGEAKWVRGPSGLGASRAEEKGASRWARAGMLEPYVEHGKQAQRSPGARIRVLRPSGGETCRLVSPRRPDVRSRRPVAASLGAFARHGRHIAPAPVSARRSPFAAKSHKSGQNPGSARENMKHSVHRGSRLPSGAFARHGAAIARHARGEVGGSQCPRAFRCGERQMKPCRERGTFSIVLTNSVDYFSPRWYGRIIESYPWSCEPGAPDPNRLV